MTGLHNSLSIFNRSGNLSPLLIFARIAVIEKPSPDTKTLLTLSSQNSLLVFRKTSWIAMISDKVVHVAILILLLNSSNMVIVSDSVAD